MHRKFVELIQTRKVFALVMEFDGINLLDFLRNHRTYYFLKNFFDFFKK